MPSTQYRRSHLPALDSIGYRTMVWRQRDHRARGLTVELEHRRQIAARYLQVLAAALAFLNDDTILRGMQLELD